LAYGAEQAPPLIGIGRPMKAHCSVVRYLYFIFHFMQIELH